MNRNLDEGRRWYAQAVHDLRAAELVQEHGFHETACFLAQQATEKALKAYLYAQGERPVLGHATHQLVLRCSEYDQDFELLLNRCRQLDQYYIPTRYPNGLPDGIPHDIYTPEQSARAVASAQAVIDEVANKWNKVAI
ncbi:MAG: HEPN domain-containing protein [Anaerolineae bacterium]